MKKEIKVLYVEMPIELHAEAKVMAAKKNVTLSTYVRRALLRALREDKSRGL